MRPVTIAAGVVGAIVAFHYVTRRIATHQQLLPPLSRRINTQVHLINQD
jgi:hypothetical protein